MPLVLLIPGLAFFSALTLYALANTVNVHTKAQTEAQGGFWSYLLAGLTGRAAVHTVVKWTRAAVSRWALVGLKPVAAWFVGLNVLLRDTFKTNADMAEATATAVERVTGHVKTGTTYKDGSTVKAKAQSASKTANAAHAQATATAGAFHGYRVSTAKTLTHLSVAVDVAIPAQLGRIKTRENKLASDQTKLRERTTSLENGATKTWEWIRTHPLSGVTAAFTGAVAIALSSLGYGFLRCRSWRNLGRGVTCNMADELGALLGLATTVAVLSDFRDLVKIAQAVERETVIGIKDLSGL